MSKRIPPPPSRRNGKISPPRPPNQGSSRRRKKVTSPSRKKAKKSSGLYDASTLSRWRERKMPLVADHADRVIRMRFNYYHPYMDEPEGRVKCDCRKEKGIWNTNRPTDLAGKLVHRSAGSIDVSIIETLSGFYIVSTRHGLPTSLYVRKGSLLQAEREMYPDKFKNDKRANAPPPPRAAKAKSKRKPPPAPPSKRRAPPPPPKPRRR